MLKIPFIPKMDTGKPKLLHINTVADRQNSVGGIMRQIASYASAHGWDARIACGRGDLSDVDYRIGGFFSIMSHVAASRLSDCEGWRSHGATVKFLKEVDKWDPDIVHLHNLHGHYLHLPTLFDWLEKRQRPVVMTFHDLWWLTGHCAFFAHNGCRGVENGCRRCDYGRGEYPISLLSRSGRNFERKHELLGKVKSLIAVAPSQSTLSVLNDAGIGEKRTVINHGVDLNEYAATGDVHRSGVLAVAARWEKRKNLNAINRLAESGLCDEPITVVGHLMGQTLNEGIRYFPAVDTRPELVKIYSSAKLLIIPSISETFGLTAVEAMACGTPVIANSASAVRDLISPKSGRSIAMDDPAAVAATIREMIADYGSYNPAETARYYSAERMGRDYLALYADLLG